MLKQRLGISADAKSRGYVMAVLYNHYTKPGIRDLVAKVIDVAISITARPHYV
jgi:hypothetical protein